MEESAACESKGTTHWWFYRVSFTRVFLAWDEMEMNNFNRAAKKKKCLPNGQGGKQVVIILESYQKPANKVHVLEYQHSHRLEAIPLYQHRKNYCLDIDVGPSLLVYQLE